MDTNQNDDKTTEFMLAEYQSLTQNVVHLENKLFNHLSFYTTWIPVFVMIWILIGFGVFYVIFWQLSYRHTMDFCKSYDDRRRAVMNGESEYDLFKPPVPPSPLKRTFGDWISLIGRKESSQDDLSK